MYNYDDEYIIICLGEPKFDEISMDVIKYGDLSELWKLG